MKINIPDKLMKKLSVLTDYDHEIAGWLIGEVKDKEYFIEDLLLPPQDVSGAEVTLDTEATAWILKNHQDKLNKIVGHWHSHNTMTAYFSGGDEKNHQEIMDGKPYFLFIVTAQSKGNRNYFDYAAKIVIHEPFELEADVEIVSEDNSFDEVKKEIEKELDGKLTKKVFTYQNVNYKGHKRDKTAVGDVPIYDLYGGNEFPNGDAILDGYLPKESVLNINALSRKQVDYVQGILNSKSVFFNMEYDMDKLNADCYDIRIFCDSNNNKKRLIKQLNKTKMLQDVLIT